MEKNIDKTMLYETYKAMLTLKMQNVFEQYYYSDLSLREIGENNNISFQAVRDALKKIDKKLEDLETKLKLHEMKIKITKLNEYMSNPNMDIEVVKEKIKELGE